MQMVMSTMDNGKMIRRMEWDTICMQMVLPIMVSGRMTSNMVRELRLGQMEQGMKVLITRERSMEKELFVLLMEVYILVTFSTMKYLGEANMFGQMVNHMKANGRKIKCMVMES